MAYERVEICDLCITDGEKRLSVATYENDEGEEFSCCEKHLEHVKNAELNFEMIED